jgi:hypothetical protein
VEFKNDDEDDGDDNYNDNAMFQNLIMSLPGRYARSLGDILRRTSLCNVGCTCRWPTVLSVFWSSLWYSSRL